MKNKYLYIFLFTLTLCLTATFAAPNLAHGRAFLGKRLRVDTRIGTELSPIDHGQNTLPPMPSGTTFQIELFIEGGSGNTTTGYTIGFDNLVDNFRQQFTIEKAEGIVQPAKRPGPNSVEAESNFPSVVPPNGYLATITLTTKQEITGTSAIRFDAFRTRVIDALDARADTLDVRDTIVLFGSTDFSFSLDLDQSPNDQQNKRNFAIKPEADIPIQIFGNGVQFLTGYIIRFEYNPARVTFKEFVVSTELPNGQTVTPLTGAVIDSVTADSRGIPRTDFVEISGASFGGSVATENALLGTILFEATEVFDNTRISLVNAEIRRNGRFDQLSLPIPLIIILRFLDGDFDRNGEVNLRDFILFAEKFGSTFGDNTYDSRFDMDIDGNIGFSDFVLFSESLTLFLEELRVTVIE
ncbi:MAG: hypothetical protein O7G87_11230 [bacterium]|nr:hypothetical protein [bacterium]